MYPLQLKRPEFVCHGCSTPCTGDIDHGADCHKYADGRCTVGGMLCGVKSVVPSGAAQYSLELRVKNESLHSPVEQVRRRSPLASYLHLYSSSVYEGRSTFLHSVNSDECIRCKLQFGFGVLRKTVGVLKYVVWNSTCEFP